MQRNREIAARTGTTPESSGVYRVSMLSGDATQLREYALAAEDTGITCLADAEAHVRSRWDRSLESLIAVITEETNGGMNQVQLDISPLATT